MKLRFWTYFRRGHSTYLVFFLSFLNFIVLQYRLLIEYVAGLEVIFSSIAIFGSLFIFGYIPIATLIGWVDYKRGAVPVDSAILSLADPWRIDVAKALIQLAEGEPEVVKKLMEKWAKPT